MNYPASYPRALAALYTLVLSAGSLSAQATLTYDADIATTTSAQDGAGLGWNTTNVNWFDGANDVVWANTTADTAIFGAAPTGVGGTVVVGTVNVGTIQFNATTTTGYTLNTGTITLGTGIVNNNGTLGSTINAKISGSGGLAYSGTGTGAVTLGNNTLIGAGPATGNDYTGITTLTGTGRLANGGRNNAFGSFGTASASALGLDYTQIGTGTGVTLSGGTLSEAFIINGTGQANAGALRFSNNTTLNSLIQLASSSRITGAFSSGNVINGNIDLQGFTLTIVDMQGTVSGAIGGTGSLILSTNSTNPLDLTNSANSFSGNLTINGSAVLGAGNNTALGTSTLIFGSGTIRSTDATARTFANTIGTFTGNAIFGATTVQTGTLSFTSTTTASLANTVRTFTTNVDTAFANGFSSSGTTGGILKAGAATLIMNGVSTYTGLTTVTAGTLGGTGTIGSATTVNAAGALNAGLGGSTTGVLSFGSTLSLAGTTTFDFNGATRGSGFDGINVTGALLNGGGLVLNFSTTLTGGTYDLFALGSQSGDFASVTLTGLGYGAGSLTNSSGTWTGNIGGSDFTYVQSTGDLTISAIPEPATFAALGGAAVLGLAALRRRRNA